MPAAPPAPAPVPVEPQWVSCGRLEGS
jgi:hypothetical protein